MGYINKQVIVDHRDVYTDETRYGSFQVQSRVLVETYQLDVPADSIYHGLTYQSERAYRNGIQVFDASYPANTDYARERIAYRSPD